MPKRLVFAADIRVVVLKPNYNYNEQNIIRVGLVYGTVLDSMGQYGTPYKDIDDDLVITIGRRSPDKDCLGFKHSDNHGNYSHQYSFCYYYRHNDKLLLFVIIVGGCCLLRNFSSAS